MKLDTKFEKKKLYSYLGEELVETLKRHEAIIAGGMITSLFTNKDINDVDVYFRSEEKIAAFVEEIWRDGQWVTAQTNKATLLIYNGVDLQLIHFDYFQTPQDIFDTFDFTVCMGAFDFKTEEFVFSDDFLKHNSQKLLKFNKNTAYPLVSLLRVKKYEDKGYRISNPELFRIAMTCMNLDINSFDELKEQLGGMYGINYDKMFEDIENEEFSLDKAIDIIQDLNLSEDYFTKPEPVTFDCVDDVLDAICKIEPKYLKYGGKIYRVGYNDVLRQVYTDVKNGIEISVEDYFTNKKLYKYVRKTEKGLFSYYDKNFEYKIGEFVTPKSNNFLYFNNYNNINDSTYSNKEDKTLLEVEVQPEDFAGMSGDHIKVKKCKVLREIPVSNKPKKEQVDSEDLPWI